jgi:general secretion pathway protein A
LLIVDEVQNMPFATLEELRMLSNIEIPNGPSLQTILVGQPEFRKIVAGPELRQLRQRVVASCHLSPMEESEVRDYVFFRLNQAGWVDDPTFADDVFPEIFRQTDGVPRRINLLCSRLILQAALDDVHKIELADVAAVAEELVSEVLSGEEVRDDSVAAGDKGVRTSISDEVLGLISDTQNRLEAVESRLQKQDRAFRKMLLSILEYLKESEAGPR